MSEFREVAVDNALHVAIKLRAERAPVEPANRREAGAEYLVGVVLQSAASSTLNRRPLPGE